MSGLFKRFITWILKRRLSQIDALYNVHEGQECYLFGDGVSIKWMDLKAFVDKPAILGNFSVYHNDAHLLNAPYCTMVEPFFFYPFFPYRGFGKLKFLRHYLHLEYKNLMKIFKGKKFFINTSNFPTVWCKNAIFVNKLYHPPHKLKNPFRERSDSHEGTFKFQLSLAIYLGFKKIYLVGHDYTHFPSRSFHFYEKGEGVPNDVKNFNHNFIKYAKQYAEIITITLDAKSETLDYITYEDFTGLKPFFRENTQIVSPEKLKSLSTWHGYTIY